MEYKLHLEELIATLSSILKDAAQLSRKRTSPPRYASSILSDLNGNAVDKHSIGDSIRQIHDFYGWMAKNNKRGLCAGTIYRTEKFMNIDIQKRDGTQNPSRNIHIEHTIPVSVLKKMLKCEFNKASFKTDEELHHILMQYSICVAFHSDEEKWLGRKFAGVPGSTNEAFEESGNKVHKFPFLRYKKLLHWCELNDQDFRIINIITGKQIDLDKFTFDDHVENLNLASRLVSNSNIYSFDAFPSRSTQMSKDTI